MIDGRKRNASVSKSIGSTASAEVEVMAGLLSNGFMSIGEAARSRLTVEPGSVLGDGAGLGANIGCTALALPGDAA